MEFVSSLFLAGVCRENRLRVTLVNAARDLRDLHLRTTSPVTRESLSRLIVFLATLKHLVSDFKWSRMIVVEW